MSEKLPREKDGVARRLSKQDDVSRSSKKKSTEKTLLKESLTSPREDSAARKTSHSDKLEKKESSKSPRKDEEPKYGPDGKGGYLTPFLQTVVHFKGDFFSECAAVLMDRVQVISITKLSEFNSFEKYGSPTLLLFTPGFSNSDYVEMKKLFPNIYVFSSSDLSLPQGVKKVHLDQFGSVIKLRKDFACSYIFEHLRARFFPTKPSGWGDEHTQEKIRKNCVNFCIGLEKYEKGHVACLNRIISASFRAEEVLQDVVAEGGAYVAHERRIGNTIIDGGFAIEKGYKIYCINNQIIDGLNDLILVHPKCKASDVVVVYHETDCKWNATIFGSVKISASAFAFKFLKVKSNNGSSTINIWTDENPGAVLKKLD